MPKNFSHTMIRKIFLGVSLCTFAIVPMTSACDPLGCMFGGDKLDTLILGEVVAEPEEEKNVEVLFVFPQNHITSLKAGDRITVRNMVPQLEDPVPQKETVSVGEKYFMSLNRDGGTFVPAFGIYEVTGTTYADAQLVKNGTIEDEALQLFIQSGGTERDFAFDYSGEQPILIRNGVPQEPPETARNPLWYGVAAMVIVIVVGGAALIVTKAR